MAAPAGIDVRGVRVRLGRFRLGPVSFTVPHGALACVLGPNGSGKTTLLRVVTGLYAPDQGEVLLSGQASRGRPPEVLRGLGFVPDDPADTLAELTPDELWELHAFAHHHHGAPAGRLLDRARELAADLGLQPAGGTIGSFSHGMRKKTQIVAALMHEPGVLVLDEPHAGLDPVAIRRLERLVDGRRQQGAAVLAATHDLHYAERRADLVCVLNEGQLVATGAPGQLARGTGFDDAFFRLVGEEVR